MKRFLFICCVVVLIPAALAYCQESRQPESGRAYTFVAPGAAVSSDGSAGALHFGGGGEAMLVKGVGIGCEIGYLAPMQYLEQGIGVLSINGLYAFRTSRLARVSPFVTGGYSLLFRDGHLNAVNFGVGMHYWFSRRVGLRLEVRDHVSPAYFNDHLLQARVGVAFR